MITKAGANSVSWMLVGYQTVRSSHPSWPPVAEGKLDFKRPCWFRRAFFQRVSCTRGGFVTAKAHCGLGRLGPLADPNCPRKSTVDRATWPPRGPTARLSADCDSSIQRPRPRIGYLDKRGKITCYPINVLDANLSISRFPCAIQ